MANKTSWVAGAGTFGAGFVAITGTEVNNLTAGNFAKGTVTAANGTDLNQFMDLSFELTAASAVTANDFVTVYLLPKNQGGTFGDNTSSGATSPASQYYVGSVVFVTAGTALHGQLNGIRLPPDDFIIGITNNTAVNLAAGGGTVYLRSYNQNLNA